MRSITIGPNDQGQRLDKFLGKYLKNLPQSLLYKYIRLKRVKVNGKRSEIAYRLVLGDVVDLYINDEFFASPREEEAFLHVQPHFGVVYEDENLLVVDKKPGLIVHSDEGEQVNTLIAQIQSYLYQKGEYRPQEEHSFAPALCNRIDRNTGGMVLAAKNAETLRILNQKIKDGELDKYYQCVTIGGHLPKRQDRLVGYHFKDARNNQCYIRPTPTKGCRTAITEYRVLEEKGPLSLLEVHLITGRTHQIRAHMASIGHPLLGDGKYGQGTVNREYGESWQLLYACRLTFAFTSDAGILGYLQGKTLEIPGPLFPRYFPQR
ncbi:MAG: RluA family pseudouridine synthase [Eubacteriales bacterium]